MPGSRDLEPKSDGEERARSRPELEDEAEPSFFAQPRRIAQTLLIVLILVAAIYVLLPKIVGLDDALATLDKGNPGWIALAVVFNVAAFAAYVALFRGVVGERVLHLEWRESCSGSCCASGCSPASLRSASRSSRRHWPRRCSRSSC